MPVSIFQTRSQLVLGVVFVTVLGFSAPVRAQIQGLPSVPGLVAPGPAPASPADVIDNTGPVAVQSRPRPDLDPKGINVGGLRLLPSLLETASYDSNIFATQTGATSDVIFRTRPELKIDRGPDPAQLMLNFDAYAEDVRYVSHGSLSNDNFGASLGADTTLRQDIKLSSQTQFTYAHQDPSSLTAGTGGLALKELPVLTTLSQDLGASRDLGLLSVAAVGGYTRQDYENIHLVNGTTLNQSQLNANDFRIGPKISYNYSADLRPFLQAQYARYSYDSNSFNSNEYSGLVGADIELRRLWRGSVFVGYKERDYDKLTIPTAGGLTYGLNLTWFPTELLTVTATGAQNFSDSTVVSSTGVHSTIDSKTFSLVADYEVLRNLIATGLTSFEDDKYLSTPREDRVYSVGAGLRYLISRNWEGLAQYQFSTRDSSSAGFSYNRNLMSIGLKLKL